MDAFWLLAGRIGLFAALTLPVWGTALVVVLKEWELFPDQLRRIIRGTITFWVINLAVLDLGAGIVFLLLGSDAQAFATQWHVFWKWGSFLILALMGGNLISVFIIKDEDISEFTLGAYIFSVLGGIAVMILWISLRVIEAVTYIPIPPAQ